MNLVYALEQNNSIRNFDRSIFLAGPTPRDNNVQSWRPEAIEILKKQNFFDTIYIPEPRNNKWESEYMNQIQWEFDMLNQSSIILFWIPRDLNSMPGFTTNVEFGMFLHKNISLGYPISAPKMKYLDWHARKLSIPIAHTLEDTIENAKLSLIKYEEENYYPF